VVELLAKLVGEELGGTLESINRGTGVDGLDDLESYKGVQPGDSLEKRTGFTGDELIGLTGDELIGLTGDELTGLTGDELTGLTGDTSSFSSGYENIAGVYIPCSISSRKRLAG
jgi:hypothetical protein